MADDPDALKVSNPDGSFILAGYELGRSARAALGLDDQDQLPGAVPLQFDAAVVTSSYIRGLLGPSVKQLGARGLAHKYRLDGSPDVEANVRAVAQVVEADPSTA